MEHKGIIASVFILILIIAGMFVFTYLKKAELNNSVPEPVTQVTPDPVSPYDNIVSVDAKHFFANGLHTLTGEIMMPTPCDLLNSDVRVMESLPEQVVVDFSVINQAESCAQMMTPQRFKVEFNASDKAQIKATLQNRDVTFNLVPASAGENPDDFELFIKG